MPGYRRNYEGSIFFFTVVTRGRRPLLAADDARAALGDILRRTAAERPWHTEAMVLLPDHLHTLWRMPAEDRDYSRRWAIIKKRFTHWYRSQGRPEAAVPAGQRRHRLRGVWQPRFWEHTIRDARDFRMHLDYIHMNPVKHGLVSRPVEWPWSSFHRYVQLGWYEPDWSGRVELPGQVESYWPE